MLSKTIAVLSAGLTLTRAAPPTVPGFSLTWSDDFIGTRNSLPNPSNWIVDIGTGYPGGPPQWGTWEVQSYTSRPDNLKLTGDGVLQITPLRDANNQWTSARIETQRSDFMARAGGKMRISARIIMPDITGEAAVGYWPAFWTLGNNYRGNYQNWPSVGEFDIMENVNGINRVWGVLHCGVNPGGPCRETDGLPGFIQCPGTPCQGNWHVYSIEVDRTTTPERLTWSVDGVNFHTVTQNDVGAETWAQAVHHGHFILLNLAIGGAFPNNNSGRQTPVAGTVPGVPFSVLKHAKHNSSASSAWSGSSTAADDTIISASTHLTSPSPTPNLGVLSSLTLRPQAIEMTTYFHYHQDGNVYPSGMPSSGPPSTYVPLASEDQQCLKDPVGAYLARRNALAAAYTGWQTSPPVISEEGEVHPNGHQPMAFAKRNSTKSNRFLHRGYMYESSMVDTEYGSQYSPTPGLTIPAHATSYPDVDEIRRQNTLQSLLPLIPPERTRNAFQGPRLDIVEAGTDVVFATHVPKKMLVLFLGREVVNKFLRTIERVDNEDWSGPPTVQVLRIPQGLGSAAAFKILFSWMFRACAFHSVQDVRDFKVPQNTYAACTLAQILGLFKLQHDARRVEYAIMNNHFKRPIHANDFEVLWNCLGENNRFVCAMVNAIRMRQTFDLGGSTLPTFRKEAREMLEKYPALKARLFASHPIEGDHPDLHTGSSQRDETSTTQRYTGCTTRCS
ncbi:concanavalin A-like lectin/glucanase domain-containing protein [Paraphoma chrysanthemicola]|nr:concanavalin A-like lectin/glucanase domain-containing protein [Paraphoma chrysanthemicola]